jgi:hypothetical protein
MAGIFISYRREDSAGHAGRLFDRLKAQFGAERVFMDVEGIAPGADFVQAIQRAVAACDVVLALIGPDWIGCTDERGQRRLDEADDFVRLEIASALREGKTVIPVLVHGASMPDEDALPHELRALAQRQAAGLADGAWDTDLARLMRTLQAQVDGDDASEPVGSRADGEGFWALLGKLLRKPIPLAALVLIGAGLTFWRNAPKPEGLNLSSPAAAPSSPSASPPAAQIAEGNLQASLSALDFGALPIGKHEALTVRVRNPENAAAHLSMIGLAGAAQDDYAIEHDCGKDLLAPHASCEVRVRFAPSAGGPREALLSVEFLGRKSPLIVKLWGEGVSRSAAAVDVR